MPTDRFVVRVIAVGLVLVALVALIVAAGLAATGHSIPELVTTMGVGGLTATAALLARTATEPPPGP